MNNNTQIRNANLMLISLLSLPAFSQEKLTEQSRPNVLFIAVDDMKPILGCYGEKLIKTPNIDRIASKGTVFLLNYCQQAVCGPTRASLMTGKRPDYTKIWDLKTRMRDMNPDILTMPQYFAQQGYTTTAIGKIYDPRCVDADIDKPSWSIPFYGYPNSYSSDYFFNNQKPFLTHFQDPENRKKFEQFLKDSKAKGLSSSEAMNEAKKLFNPSVECLDLPDNAYGDGVTTIKALEILSQLSKEK